MVDINFGHTQSMQRELQAQQDFTVAEIFGKQSRGPPVGRSGDLTLVAAAAGGERGAKSEPRKLVSLARLAEEGSQAKKHCTPPCAACTHLIVVASDPPCAVKNTAHPEFSGRQLRLDGYWRDGSTGVTTLKRVAISYNLEDDTMSVKVVADKKRGVAEMTLLKNHLVPKPMVGPDQYSIAIDGP